MHNGFVKLYRKLLENPIFQKPNVLVIFIYCLLKANYTRKEIIWNGKTMVIERGSFITGRTKIAQDTGFSEQKVRTAFTALELQGMVKKSTTKSTNKFSYRTVCNYDAYQDSNRSNNQQTNQQATSKQPQLRSNKKEKNTYGSSEIISCPIDKIVELYHAILPELPRIVKMTERRRRQLNARWNESKKWQSLDKWQEFFEYVQESPYLMGNTNNGNKWKANLEWLTKEDNFIKIIEGNYHS
tara:strand:+ start:1896 stop:2618 length:723 start_codon:yes stop_codon:yes gene_type:complete